MQEKTRFGKIGYLLSAVRTIGDNAPFSYKLEYDGNFIEGEGIMILVLNGCFIGTNLLPFPMVSPDDGVFGVAILENASFGAFLEKMAMKRSRIERTIAKRLLELESLAICINSKLVRRIKY
ncbi:hypothetical protein ACQKKK_25565 [Peribacillus sp. NPDC006672]|uniref:hypothetical protein n=1 Tax=Peribacillus sp. NPDC006672 TaxID=3390606 RepID=UPI003D003113